MFSVTYTGTKSFPLWTWKVIPIMSGVIIERRDQVRTACFAPVRAIFSTLRCKLGSTKGPFLSDRAI
jgi:hypothetical protein